MSDDPTCWYEIFREDFAVLKRIVKYYGELQLLGPKLLLFFLFGYYSVWGKKKKKMHRAL